MNLVKVRKMSEYCRGKHLVGENLSQNVKNAVSIFWPFSIFHFDVAEDYSVFKLCVHSFWNFSAFIV